MAGGKARLNGLKRHGRSAIEGKGRKIRVVIIEIFMLGTL
jgi:hypothetical protein